MKINCNLMGKLDSPVDEGIFLGYSLRNKAYKCYNNQLCKVVERIDVKVYKALPKKEADLTNEEDLTLTDQEKIVPNEEQELENLEEEKETETPTKTTFTHLSA